MVERFGKITLTRIISAKEAEETKRIAEAAAAAAAAETKRIADSAAEAKRIADAAAEAKRIADAAAEAKRIADAAAEAKRIADAAAEAARIVEAKSAARRIAALSDKDTAFRLLDKTTGEVSTAFGVTIKMSTDIKVLESAAQTLANQADIASVTAANALARISNSVDDTGYDLLYAAVGEAVEASELSISLVSTLTNIAKEAFELAAPSASASLIVAEKSSSTAKVVLSIKAASALAVAEDASLAAAESTSNVLADEMARSLVTRAEDAAALTNSTFLSMANVNASVKKAKIASASAAQSVRSFTSVYADLVKRVNNLNKYSLNLDNLFSGRFTVDTNTKRIQRLYDNTTNSNILRSSNFDFSYNPLGNSLGSNTIRVSDIPRAAYMPSFYPVIYWTISGTSYGDYILRAYKTDNQYYEYRGGQYTITPIVMPDAPELSLPPELSIPPSPPLSTAQKKNIG
jgi:hypothetical protein